MSASNIDALSINTIRTLSIDSVEKANSGHPGLPMGSAPMAYVLWSQFLKHNPADAAWPNRDRFVLSAGHGSMLLYSLLHLFGYGLTREDLMQFRQWGSKTPGHPEFGHTRGVETTTGPLGQGITNAVGFAMAERFLAARYNRPDHEIIDHMTYTLVGDGDLMEGISYEAMSFAGHQKLGKLVVLYDSNDISLDGPTDMAFTENIKLRAEAAGWHYLRVENGDDDLDAIARAIAAAKSDPRPSLLEIRTTIGYGSPGRQGTSKAHGSPLGAEETALAKTFYQWNESETHFVPSEVTAHFQSIATRGAEAQAAWEARMSAYEKVHPELAAELRLALSGELPANWDADLPTYTADKSGFATRQISGAALNAIAKRVPTLFGGSADLAGSNETTMKTESVYSAANPAGRNVWFGVREHAMGAMLNGLALHGGVHPYGGTFLVFSDYLRPSIRLAALMKLPVIYVFTHDSIGVGEDGPTHQPIEQIAALRLIPNLLLIRPADANETVAAWHYAMAHRDRPVALALTRQKLPVYTDSDQLARQGVARGAYTLSKESAALNILLIASGSEVILAMGAQKALEAEGIGARVVSIPCPQLFLEQTAAYQEEVLPSSIRARVVIEMAHPAGLASFAKDHGVSIGIDHFGASAPAAVLMEKFGFTVSHVIAAAKASLREVTHA
ncbi:transketolase [Ferroacidibacillus organovorans]|uniref:Transketolase n=1 Tax=Ferroacidibacillus organovorans TaxID=1765683 RepID=A0A1V4EQW3_9BACL|nr:transketolase [Ferroacidibacillus organovorans]OPG15319.1 transketolase [Ferroacidibacillus organovorans]